MKNRESKKRYVTSWYEKNKERVRAKKLAGVKARYRRLRDQVVEGYGGRCTCCGEAQRLFLSIQHVEGDGSIHRKRHGSTGNSIGVLLDIIQKNFPLQFTVFCMNCNVGSYLNGGVCPHQLEG